MRNNKTIEQIIKDNKQLKLRLEEAEETIRAIQEGGIDAIVVQAPRGEQIYTLSGEDTIYRRLVETMNEAGVTLTPEGRILFCNQCFGRMLRLPMEQIVGQPVEVFLQSSSRPVLADLLERVVSEPGSARLVFRASDGTPVPMLASANLLVQGDSKTVCLVAANMTDLEARNLELKQRADQLARLASELTLTEQRERRRLARVLHDHLQQLLVGAKFGLEGFGRKVIDEEDKSFIDDIYELINESIAVSRSLTVELSPTILYEAGLAAGLEWLARWMEQKHGLLVELEIEPHVSVERDDIRILLFESVRELLFNVTKHAKVTRANIGVSRSSDQVRIVVTDEGVGFDPDQLRRSGGMGEGGFGLFSIRERLELIGGSLVIESAPQRGARFTLTAPAKETLPTEAEGPAPSSAAEPAQVLQEAETKIRVLIADDHTVVRQGLTNLLQRERGIEVIGQAADGQEAVEKAQQLRPDVILMDFSMPQMNGVDATRVIHARQPETRIIGLSMYDEADRAKAMMDVGASAYVTKSAEFSRLVNTIRSAGLAS